MTEQKTSSSPLAPFDLANSWLTDRTRIRRGRRCARARWWEFHAQGTGLKPRAHSLPLATGTHVHLILEGLLKGEEPGVLIPAVAQKYRDEVKGFLGEIGAEAGPEEAAAEQTYLVTEQAWLVECLGWALHLWALPRILDVWEVVEVEVERPLILEDGVVLQTRGDFVARHRREGVLAAWDGKTTADPHGYLFMRGWDLNPQLSVVCRALEAHLGEPVPGYYVLGIGKGQRKRSYEQSTQDYTGPKRQKTPLCHAYYNPGNPPFQDPEWRYASTWKDPETGKTRKLTKGFESVPAWEGGKGAREWVAELPESVLRATFNMLGPLQTHAWMVEGWLRGVAAEEARWRALAWEAAENGEGDELLDVWAPQNWDACWDWNRRCEFWGLCTKQPGVEGEFKAREPHHQEERDQWEGEEG